MGHISFNTPLGIISLSEHLGKISSLYWGPLETNSSTEIIQEAKRQVQKYFAGSLKNFQLPIMFSGLSMQQAVYRELRKIPFGDTRSYGDIARLIGYSPRAVGVACARNTLPIIIPCHRVVAACGKMAGYSAGNGVQTKTWLLNHEKTALLNMTLMQ